MRNNNVTKFAVAALLLVNAAVLPAWSRVLRNGAAGRSADGESTLTGLVSDSRCKGQPPYHGATRSSCTWQCVAHGADYVLVVDNSVYTLNGHKDDLDKFAGGNATVTGHVSGNSISVDSVATAK